MQPDLSRAQWKKSSYSSTGNCVEVAQFDGAVAVRDSKDPERPALVVAGETWRSFINGLNARPAV